MPDDTPRGLDRIEERLNDWGSWGRNWFLLRANCLRVSKAEWVEAVPGVCVERLCKRCKEDGLYLVAEGRMGSTTFQRQGGGILP